VHDENEGRMIFLLRERNPDASRERERESLLSIDSQRHSQKRSPVKHDLLCFRLEGKYGINRPRSIAILRVSSRFPLEGSAETARKRHQIP